MPHSVYNHTPLRYTKINGEDTNLLWKNMFITSVKAVEITENNYQTMLFETDRMLSTSKQAYTRFFLILLHKKRECKNNFFYTRCSYPQGVDKKHRFSEKPSKYKSFKNRSYVEKNVSKPHSNVDNEMNKF